MKTAFEAVKWGSVGTVSMYGVGAIFTAATGGAAAIVLAGATKTLSATGAAAGWLGAKAAVLAPVAAA